MNSLGGLFSWLGRVIGIGTSSQRFWASWAGVGTHSGEIVTVERAMTVAAFWRAVRLIAETVSTLPLNIFEVGADGKASIVTDPANPYRIVLKNSPNQEQTAVEFWEGLIGCMLVIGDGFAHKIRVGSRLVAMTQMDPTRTTVIRDPQTLELTYRYIGYDGKTSLYPAAEVFHLKGFGFGGDRGMSVIQFGAQSFGAVLAADKVAAKMFRSGLSSSGFLETGSVLNEPDRERLEKIMSAYQGSDNAGKLMILEGGMKYNPVTMSAADAQLLSSRGFNIEEVARWFGVPPILLGHSAAGQTMWGTGVEQIVQAWYTLGLRAILGRVETAIQKRVIEPADQVRYYAKFAVEGLLRGDSTARAALYASAAQNGWMTRNEIRELEEFAPYEGDGADKLTAQVNLVPLDDLGASAAAPGQASTTQQSEQIKQLVRGFLGLDATASAQDVADIRAAIAQLRAERRTLELVPELAPAARLPAPRKAA